MIWGNAELREDVMRKCKKEDGVRKSKIKRGLMWGNGDGRSRWYKDEMQSCKSDLLLVDDHPIRDAPVKHLRPAFCLNFKFVKAGLFANMNNLICSWFTSSCLVSIPTQPPNSIWWTTIWRCHQDNFHFQHFLTIYLPHLLQPWQKLRTGLVPLFLLRTRWSLTDLEVVVDDLPHYSF